MQLGELYLRGTLRQEAGKGIRYRGGGPKDRYKLPIPLAPTPLSPTIAWKSMKPYTPILG